MLPIPALGVIALAVLMFYNVSGGPFGIEPAVQAAGPMYAIIGFMVFPLIWCIPEALMTAELGSALPEPSGPIAWVEEAFGSKAGLLSGYLHWISGATDNAIYPSLFLKYLASYLASASSTASTSPLSTFATILSGWLTNTVGRFILTVTITIALSALNYTGLEIVGNFSIIVSILSMIPFVILVIVAIPKLDPNRWFVLPTSNTDAIIMAMDDDTVGDTDSTLLQIPAVAGVLWRPFLNNLFWNLNGLDSGGCFAGEIRNPDKVFPRAMFLSGILIVFSYLLPLMAALGAVDTKQVDWEAGYLTTVAEMLAGHWLGAWIVFAAAISNLGMYEAEMSGDAYQLMGMAERGLIPKFFAARSTRFGTPYNGIFLGTFVIVILSVADFDELVEMLNFALALSMLIEFAAFVKLRITDDDST